MAVVALPPLFVAPCCCCVVAPTEFCWDEGVADAVVVTLEVTVAAVDVGAAFPNISC